MSDVGDLLETLRSGAELESPGRFTINYRDAATPYRAFVHECAAWPWLRLLQIALRQGASRVQFKTSRNAVSCKFQPTAGALRWLEAGSWLMGRGGEPPEAAMADVLLGLVASAAARWRIGLVEDQDEAFISYRSDEGLQIWGRATDRAVVCVQADFPPEGWFGLGRSRVAAVRASFVQRCLFSPVPIEVDGTVVNDPNWANVPGLEIGAVELTCPFTEVCDTLVWPSPDQPAYSRLATPSTQSLRALRYLVNKQSLAAWNHEQCSVLCLSLQCGGEPELVRVLPNQPLPTQPRLPLAANLEHHRCAEQYFLTGAPDCFLPHLSRMSAFIELEQAVTPLLGMLHRIVVPLGTVGVGQLSLVRDGVATDPVSCDLGYSGLVALTSDPRLKTDASGLQVVRDEGFHAVCGELRQAAPPAVWAVHGLLEEIKGGESIGLADSLRLELLTRLRSRG